MPIYCYRLPDGRVVERQAPMSRVPKFVRIDGVVARRDFMAERGRAVGTSSTWGGANVALGVHPSQVPELQRLLKKRGVRDTQFDPLTGDCIVQDRRHRNEILMARGMRDQNGGYGDHCGFH